MSIDLLQSQRYYHLISYTGQKNLLKKSFLKDWKISARSKVEINEDCILNLMSITTDYRYYRGEDDLSINKNDKPPFMYDIFALEHKKLNMTILGFPFKSLTRNITKALVNDYGFIKTTDFLKTDLNKLIHVDEKHTDYYHNKNHFFFKGVYLTLSGNSYVSTVKLEGKKPLDSDIYKEYFKERLAENKSHLEKCVLRSNTEIDYIDETIKSSSSFHIDKFGNYKLYVHSHSKNITTIISLFEFLHDNACLVETSKNPVLQLRNEE